MALCDPQPGHLIPIVENIGHLGNILLEIGL